MPYKDKRKGALHESERYHNEPEVKARKSAQATAWYWAHREEILARNKQKRKEQREQQKAKV